MRRLGASVDWTRDRFTMDAGLSRAVTEVFVRLYDERLIYRGKRLVNWDPVLKTALSDLEVVSSEENGYLWHLRYPLADGEGFVVVATTRPETMLGDAAVAVHPDDERYRHLIGRQLRLPLADREIPIIADDYVDPAFGSGCVKITPAHDFNDYEVGQRHDLPMINIFTPDAALNESVPAPYRGLDRLVARERVLADLEALGLIERIEPHRLTVPRGERSNAVLEPLLTDQWFVDIKPLAEPALKAVEQGRIRFIPENWTSSITSGCTRSRIGASAASSGGATAFPLGTTPRGAATSRRAKQEARAKYGLDPAAALRQDEDVLDTWFSSALWPFSTQGWPERTRDLERYYPTSVLVTGFDIIFFWVARMIMMGLKFAGDVPFRAVYIHGLIRDHDGQKMSKSKGNVIDPLDIVDGISLEELLAKRTSGSDAAADEAGHRKGDAAAVSARHSGLRHRCPAATFASLATQSRDLRFDLAKVEGFRNFCNKLWNAARYVLMNVEGKELAPQGGGSEPSLADRWIRTRLKAMLARVEQGFAEYRLDMVASALYEFTWNEFCDWYLELSKAVLQSDASSEQEKRAARRTLIDTLETLLRALHPLAPFISEEIWQRVRDCAGAQGPSIMLSAYPREAQIEADPGAEAEMRWVMNFILGVRQIRGEMDIAPARRLDVVLQNAGAGDVEYLARNRSSLMRLAGVCEPRILAPGERAPISAVALVGQLEILRAHGGPHRPEGRARAAGEAPAARGG